MIIIIKLFIVYNRILKREEKNVKNNISAQIFAGMVR